MVCFACANAYNLPVSCGTVTLRLFVRRLLRDFPTLDGARAALFKIGACRVAFVSHVPCLELLDIDIVSCVSCINHS